MQLTGGKNAMIGWGRLVTAVVCIALLSGCAQQRLRDKATAEMRDGHYEAAVKTLC